MGLTAEQRAKLQSFVTKARVLVDDDFKVQMQSVYGMSESLIQPLDAMPSLSQAELTTARILRERFHHIRASTPEGRSRDATAFARLARELSFGIVNRFAAVRMAEKRQLIEPSLAELYNSSGFLSFKDAASSGLILAFTSTYEAYRQYLKCIFDELATDLGEVMASDAVSCLLFPSATKLEDLIKLMNDGAVDPLWAEDETIGWIYQYYNDPDERKQMREDSQVPRTSRELAVRNQFFTPRYVVEFLTDNTLGRIWYEMTQGKTELVNNCRYLVRRPQTKFLAAGEKSTTAPIPPELPSAERLKLPEEVPHRPTKDPRQLRFLDPACGSMHFGLYAFELFELIYAEAWDHSIGTLRTDFPERVTFLREVPRLILENNIYGVDIDPRAVQIARLALWLRAQKAWQQLQVSAIDRPRIRKSHVVCAEPMPGSAQLLEEFITVHLAGTPEKDTLAKLLRRIVTHMISAGEAGVLLRIEAAISDIVKSEKRRDQGVIQKSLPGISSSGTVAAQDSLPGFSFGGIVDESFWANAEAQLYEELARYASSMEQGGLQRRMFAEDATQGFAFIDLCRERFDVVVMNPPFGEATERCHDIFDSIYTNWASNILSCFLIRSLELLNEAGICGAIFDRTALIKSSYESLRQEVMINRINCLADTGWDVLDANVETACMTFSRTKNSLGAFIDVRRSSVSEKANKLLFSIDIGLGKLESEILWLNSGDFKKLPNSVIGYDFDRFAINTFSRFAALNSSGYQARQGHALVSDFHFRNFWEFSLKELNSKKHHWVYNGSDFSLFVSPVRMLVLNGSSSLFLESHRSVVLRNNNYQLKSGIGYGKRGEILDAHLLTSNQLFTSEGQAIHGISKNYKILLLLASLNSKLSQYLINLFCGQHKHAGYVNLLPDIAAAVENQEEVEGLVVSIINLKIKWLAHDETDASYAGPAIVFEDSSKDEFDRRLTCITESYERSQVQYDTLISQLNEVFFSATGLCLSEIEKVEKWWSHFGYKDSVWPCLRREGIEKLTPSWLVSDYFSYLFGVVFSRWNTSCVFLIKKDFFCEPSTLQPAINTNTQDVLSFFIESTDIYLKILRANQTVLGNVSNNFIEKAHEFLGVNSIENWLNDSNGFFSFHLRRYTKSHRSSPIYWPLSTKSANFTLWIYYPKLDNQSLPKLIADVLSPKIRILTQEIENRRATPGGKTAELESLRQEIEEMRTDFTDLISRGYVPNQNDGVLITASPLAKYFRHTGFRKELEVCWKELSQGDYDWAHLAMSMWPERVLEVCKKDRSIAIAHGREELFPAEPVKAKRASKQSKSDD